MTTATPSPPANALYKPAFRDFVAIRIYFVIGWHIIAGVFGLLFALMMLFPDAFKGQGRYFDTTLKTLQSISTSTVFRWASPEFIDGVVIVLLVVFGGAMLAQVPGLWRRRSSARLTALALNFIGFILSSFYMIRQMTVNPDVLLASIDEPIKSGPFYEVFNSLPGSLPRLVIDGYWLDRFAQGANVLPFVLLFGVAAYFLFNQRIGEVYHETLAQREAILAYLYISPYLLLASVFTIGLFILAFYLSFNDLDLFGSATWVGLENYQKALEDTKFLISLSNVIWYALIVVTLQTTFALLLAVAMNAPFKGRRFFRTLFYAPSVTSSVVISLIFLWLFSGRGFINTVIFDTLGLGPAIESLGIRIPPGSPGLQWFNTPNRLGDLTFLKPFFDGSWVTAFAVLASALAAIMALRVFMWWRFSAFSRRAALIVFGISAGGTIAGVLVYVLAVGGTSRPAIIESAVYLAGAMVALTPLITNRLPLALDRSQGLRSTLLGGGAWLLVVTLVAWLSGEQVGNVSAITGGLGVAVFSLLGTALLVTSTAVQARRETGALAWASIEGGGLLRMAGKLAAWGGVWLPSMLAVLVGIMAVIAHQTQVYDTPTAMPVDSFVPLVVRGPSVAFMSVMAMNIFTTSPTFMIMYLAALQDIPPQLYEAAEIDGANRVQRFFQITVPLLRPITLLIVVLGTIGTLQIFDQIAIITRGGPLDTTLTPVYLIFTTALGDNIRARVGYASAMAFILGVIIFVFTFIQRRYLESGTEQY